MTDREVRRRDRRAFLRDLGRLGAASAGVALLGGCELSGPSQGAARRLPRIGYIAFDSDTGPGKEQQGAFRQGLRDLGYIEGQTIAVEWRSAEGRAERISEIAAEVDALRLDAIVSGFNSAINALRDQRSTTPIVFFGGFDAVGSGAVTDLAHPGGNLTGVSAANPGELVGKQMEILKEAAPAISRVALFTNADNPAAPLAEAMSAARSLGIELVSLRVRSADDFDAVLTAAAVGRADALLVLAGGIAGSRNDQIAAFALRNRMPSIGPGRQFVAAGGLMSYGSSAAAGARRAAWYVDRILKGARPGDLPVEFPTKYDLILNLSTSRQLELTIPPSVLAQATELIR